MAFKKKEPVKVEVKNEPKPVKPKRDPTKEELAAPHHPSIHTDGCVCLNCDPDLKK